MFPSELGYFSNDKPWFTAKLKQFCQAKEVGYRSGDKALLRQARNTLTKETGGAIKATLMS